MDCRGDLRIEEVNIETNSPTSVSSNSRRPLRPVPFPNDAFEVKHFKDSWDSHVQSSARDSVPLQLSSERLHYKPKKRMSLASNHLLTLWFILFFAGLHHVSIFGSAGVSSIGVLAGSALLSGDATHSQGAMLERADSSTDVCTRWSQQTAIVNGTLCMAAPSRSLPSHA